MKTQDAVIAGLVGAGLGAGIYALASARETLSAVVWAGDPLAPMQNAILDALNKGGIRLPDGNLKQEVTPDGVSVLLVRPSDLARARGLVETVRPR
jgi:hypothetical protein